MVDEILDLEAAVDNLIRAFEHDHKCAVTALSLEREGQSEDSIGSPVVKAHFVVPYTIER